MHVLTFFCSLTESDKCQLFHDNVMNVVNIQLAKLLSLNFVDQMIYLFGLAAASSMTIDDGYSDNGKTGVSSYIAKFDNK